MNIAKYISDRILRTDDRSQISRPIVRIATIGIVVGVAMMLMSVCIVSGFQQEIRNKVIGFGSHFQVIGGETNFSQDSHPLLYDTLVYDKLKSVEGVRQVQVFATKPGILETKEAIQGIVVKGVSADFDWSFLKNALQSGDALDPLRHDSLDLVISEYLAHRLKLAVGDRVSLYVFNKEADPRQRNFVVRGIYNSGLEDYDKQFVFVDIRHVQRLAGWGLRLEVMADSVVRNGSVAIGAQAFGGDGNYRYAWSRPDWQGEGPHFCDIATDTLIQVKVWDSSNTKPDSVEVRLRFPKDLAADRVVSEIKSPDVDAEYIGGYEVLIKDYKNLMLQDDRLFEAVASQFLQVVKITDRSPEIFAWLEMLDVNVIIIIVLMIVISVVNMTSALLIIILERQQMIGTLKALGIQDNPVIRIFLRNAIHIIGRGMIWGNVLGLGLAVIQYFTHFVHLDPTHYYVDFVPIRFDWTYIIMMNGITLVVCALCMVLPAMYVLRISPIRAIRFS
ncbi:MAG: ABC transporter permease [Flavobacteriales bacterium]